MKMSAFTTELDWNAFNMTSTQLVRFSSATWPARGMQARTAGQSSAACDASGATQPASIISRRQVLDIFFSKVGDDGKCLILRNENLPETPPVVSYKS